MVLEEFYILIVVTDKAIKSIAQKIRHSNTGLCRTFPKGQSLLDHLHFIYHASSSHSVFIALGCLVQPAGVGRAMSVLLIYAEVTNNHWVVIEIGRWRIPRLLDF